MNNARKNYERQVNNSAFMLLEEGWGYAVSKPESHKS
jgi:hypothetical protein